MSDQTMTGRTVLVTGASDGIGAETARVLAARGATVHVTGRSADKLRPVAEAVGTEPLVADFSRLSDVRRLAEQVAEATEDGHEDHVAGREEGHQRRLDAGVVVGSSVLGAVYQG